MILTFVFVCAFIHFTLVSITRARSVSSKGRQLSQIEDVCPLQDVTCADDTNKVVKVFFSVHSAKVRCLNVLSCNHNPEKEIRIPKP